MDTKKQTPKDKKTVAVKDMTPKSDKDIKGGRAVGEYGKNEQKLFLPSPTG